MIKLLYYIAYFGMQDTGAMTCRPDRHGKQWPASCGHSELRRYPRKTRWTKISAPGSRPSLRLYQATARAMRCRAPALPRNSTGNPTSKKRRFNGDKTRTKKSLSTERLLRRLLLLFHETGSTPCLLGLDQTITVQRPFNDTKRRPQHYYRGSDIEDGGHG